MGWMVALGRMSVKVSGRQTRPRWRGSWWGWEWEARQMGREVRKMLRRVVVFIMGALRVCAASEG